MPQPTGPYTPSFRSILGVAFAALLSSPSIGQVDSTSLPVGIEEPVRETGAAGLKPSIGLGPGMFAFYGDVGKNSAGYSPLVTRVAFELRASTPITPWLEGGIYALHGRLGVNERSLDRNVNFDSRITTGGLQLRYNFLQLLNPKRVVEPYVTVGFESVEFLTKTDLFDSQGRAYNYWSDGTIRDLPENATNAGDAVLIERDYTYESDVRESDLDGFGKYLERTWAVPVGIGARMDIGHGFDFRMGATMHFTLTDLIDGVTDQSLGNRQGTTGNDRFLFTSFSVGYTIPMEPKAKKVKKTPLSSDELDLLAWTGDEDGDGVQDVQDKCPYTPAGAAVDAFGCPLDGDNDGVPDHADDELNTVAGAPVDARGVAITDEALLKAWLAYRDSGNVNMVTSRVESFGPMKPAFVPVKRVYVVKVGSQLEKINEDVIQKLLSLPDIRTVEHGDTTFFVVGSYDKIPEALRRELELRGMGVEGVVMAEENGRLIDVSNETDPLRASEENVPSSAGPTGEIIVRVQLGAFRYPLSKNIFSEIGDLVTIKGDDGLTRYYTGSFKEVNPAAAHKVQMLLKGFNGAFLVAFRDGKRISMQEAGAKLTGPEDLRNVPSGSIDKSKLRYRVQIGRFVGNVPMETMDQMIEMGDVESVPSTDAVRYFYGSFADRRSAEEAKKAIQIRGFDDAFVVGQLGGHVIPADEADELMRQP
ncbi:MAG: thrombospondin type 3 repeat-containing protein [Flavobacteriales bacterium]|nr:thrombospondin type 3 repeat-containing protein [Flavobacteriales bacterium]